MKKYNKKELVSIEIFLEEKSNTIYYKEEKKSWWGKITQSGYYEKYYSVFGEWRERYLGKKLPNIVNIKNNIIFDKPYLILLFSNNKKASMMFNTDKELNLYIKRNFQNIDWIDIDK